MAASYYGSANWIASTSPHGVTITPNVPGASAFLRARDLEVLRFAVAAEQARVAVPPVDERAIGSVTIAGVRSGSIRCVPTFDANGVHFKVGITDVFVPWSEWLDWAAGASLHFHSLDTVPAGPSYAGDFEGDEAA